MARATRPTAPPAETDAAPRRGRLPPLSMLRAFEAVGRLASMRRAAEELAVSHTVVSRHVRNLEDWLGVRLLERSSRGVRPTEAGRVLLRAAAAAFDTLAAATAELRPPADRAALRLWSVPGLAARFLAPRLADLQAALPGVEIVLRATTERPDFARAEADGEILYAEAPPADGRVELIERSRLIPVAAPAWIAARPPIETLEHLARAELLHEESRDQWRRWFERAGHAPRVDLAGPRLWYASSALDAAVAGQGVALATRLQAADDLAAGRLVELLATDVHLGAYWFVTPEARGTDLVLARFRVWLADAVAATTAAGPRRERPDHPRPPGEPR